MKKNLLACFIACVFGLTNTKAQTPAFKGIYVDSFDGIVGNTAKEDTLLHYLKDSSYNAIICYNITNVVSTVQSSTKNTALANFLKRARTQFGIKNILASSEDFATFANLISPYNKSRVDSNERFNFYYLEFEFWNTRSTSPVSASNNGYYCTNFLSPRGYACDTAGAFKYYRKILKSIDSLATKDGIRSATYVGKPNAGQAKVIGSTVDLLFCHNYTAKTSSIYVNLTTLFSYFGALSKPLQVVPIFASYSPDGPFLGDWLMLPPVGPHSEKGIYNDYFYPRFTAETASWKSKLILAGYQWYRYSGMPHNGNFTAAATSCGVVSGLSNGSTTDVSAALSWTATPGAGSYAVQYRKVGSSAWITTSSTTTSLNLSGLLASSIYEFQVQAICASGMSAYSSSYLFTTLASVCNLPTTLSASSITTNSAVLSWAAISGVSGYTIQYRIVGSATWLSTSSTTNSKNILALTENSTYEFQVLTNCTATNASAFSGSTTFNTLAPTCGVPTAITAVAGTTTSITVYWSGTSTSLSYSLQYKKASSSSWTTVTSTDTYKNIASLSSGTSYNYRVASVCSSGTSAYSATGTLSTLSSSNSCGIPTVLYANSISSNSAVINWYSGTSAASYQVQYRKSGASSWTSTTTSFANKSLSSLAANTTYQYQVKTVCSSGSSSYSASATFTTLAAAARVAALPDTLISNQTNKLQNEQDLVSEILSKEEFKIFPNPTDNENINIQISLNSTAELRLVLYDMLGKELYSQSVKIEQAGFAQINLHPALKLPAGIYQLIGFTETSKLASKLIIK